MTTRTYSEHAHVQIHVQRDELRDDEDRSDASSINTVFGKQVGEDTNTEAPDLVGEFILLGLQLCLILLESWRCRWVNGQLQTGNENFQQDVFFLFFQVVDVLQCGSLGCL